MILSVAEITVCEYCDGCSINPFCTFSFAEPLAYRERRPVREDVRVFHKRLFEVLVSRQHYKGFASKENRANVSISLSDLAKNTVL